MAEILKCRDCGDSFKRKYPIGVPAQRCKGCAKERQRQRVSVSCKLWRKRNYEWVREYERKWSERRRRLNGVPTRKQYISATRSRMLKDGKEAIKLFKRGSTYAQIGIRLGMTRGAVAGLIDRVRRYEAQP